ncbi:MULTISPECIES: hypothetical protein [unclassified Nocardia]|uniref:hypothetical protein n=1 Tax=unclassified Nocardia TaxID=2637762 RepID=UPI0035DD6F49
MAGSNVGADPRDATPWRRLPAPVAGVAAAVGAVSLGLVLIGACGLGGQDTYVAPPPLNADLQAAPVVSATKNGTTTPAVVIPPSPTWRVAADQPPRHSPISSLPTTDPKDANPDAEAPTTASRTTPLHPSTTRPTTTRPRPTTDNPAPTTEYTRTTPPATTEPAIAVPTTEDDSPASG